VRQRRLSRHTLARLPQIQQETIQLPHNSSMQVNKVEPSSIAGSEPRDNDVLLGKSKFAFHHHGNSLYRQLIDEHWKEYQKASRYRGKAIVVQRILNEIDAVGGRFLKFRNEFWEVVHHDEIHTKVAHAFRNRKTTSRRVQRRRTRASLTQPSRRTGGLEGIWKTKLVLPNTPLESASSFQINDDDDDDEIEPLPITFGIPVLTGVVSDCDEESVHSNETLHQTHDESENVEPTPIAYGAPLPTFDSEEEDLLRKLFGVLPVVAF